jgi:hypothetical protein
MLDSENPESSSVHLTTMCSQPEYTKELSNALRDMIQLHVGGEDAPRSAFPHDLLGWFIRSAQWAFNPQTLHFTDWGGPVMKTALAALLEYGETRLPIELVVWIRASIVPAVFTETPMSELQQEIAHILVQCLLRVGTLAPQAVVGSSDKLTHKRHRHN